MIAYIDLRLSSTIYLFQRQDIGINSKNTPPSQCHFTTRTKHQVASLAHASKAESGSSGITALHSNFPERPPKTMKGRSQVTGSEQDNSQQCFQDIVPEQQLSFQGK